MPRLWVLVRQRLASLTVTYEPGDEELWIQIRAMEQLDDQFVNAVDGELVFRGRFHGAAECRGMLRCPADAAQEPFGNDLVRVADRVKGVKGP